MDLHLGGVKISSEVPAYHKVYLGEVIKAQGHLFDRLQDRGLNIDTNQFIINYMKSSIREGIDRGEPTVACKNCEELWRMITIDPEEEHIPLVKGEEWKGWGPMWIGEVYTYFQWKYNVKSAWLVDVVTPKNLWRCYPGWHDLTLDHAADRIAGVPYC